MSDENKKRNNLNWNSEFDDSFNIIAYFPYNRIAQDRIRYNTQQRTYVGKIVRPYYCSIIHDAPMNDTIPTPNNIMSQWLLYP